VITERRAIAEAVDGGDLDELIRLVDGLCAARDWDGVVFLRDRCRHVLEERGLQMWPAAEFAEYRMALEAPADYAGSVVAEGAGRFALGPLWEVAAAGHTWSDLAPHVPDGPARTMAAHERVIRGEDLRGEGSVDPLLLDLPLRLEPWEIPCPPAVYRSHTADFPTPALPATAPLEPGTPGAPIDDEESVEALLDLGSVWVELSNGSRRAVAVEGGISAAVAALGFDDVVAAAVEAPEAMAWMAWAGASGGAYGRRRGGPTGRFLAWWAAAAIAGLDWPVDPAELHEAAAGLKWMFWLPESDRAGWRLHLAVASPEEGVAWALSATDSHRDDDPLAADHPGPFAPPDG
jgi:hypothetical protein